MKLIFWDFTIEQDDRCFILSEYWDKVNTKDWTTSYWLKNQIYPATIERALSLCLDRIKWKYIWDVNLKEYLDEIKITNKIFLDDLKEQLWN